MLFKRMLTSAGHGVHSPMAFELITQVLSSSEACYYATPSLPDADSRRWLRVAARFNPRTVRLLGEADSRLDRVFRLVGAKLTDDTDTTFIAAVRPTEADIEHIALSLADECTVMLADTPRRAVERIAAGRNSGLMTFSGRREHYLVARPDLPRQHFDIIMR